MEIRERLIAESCMLFMKHGLRSVSMDDIAKHLAVSKRTIYDNFKDKDELIYTVLELHRENMKLFKKEITTKYTNFFEIIFNILYFAIQHFKQINVSFFYDLKKYHPKIWNKFNEDDKEIIETTVNLIIMGQNQELIRKDINVEIVSIIFNSQLKAISNDEIFPPDKYPLEEIFKNIIVNFARGIATDKGILIIDQLINEKEIELSNNK